MYLGGHRFNEGLQCFLTVNCVIGGCLAQVSKCMRKSVHDMYAVLKG